MTISARLINLNRKPAPRTERRSPLHQKSRQNAAQQVIKLIEGLGDAMTLEKTVCFFMLMGIAGFWGQAVGEEKKAMSEAIIKLPPPDFTVNCDVNRALQERRSVREYADRPLTLKEVAELLWAAQGITSLGGYRTAPSAGALYPLEVWLAVGRVEGLDKGLYRYDPRGHALKKIRATDVRDALAQGSLGQMWMASAPAMIIFTAVPARTKSRYGERGMRYVYMEVGHASQNVSLAAVALKLGTVVVAAFDDARIAKILELTSEEVPLYIMPVGHKQD